MKKIFLLLFVIVLVSCKKDAVNKNNQNLFYYLPNNPSVVIQSNSLEDFNSIINNNELIQKFSNTDSYKKIQSNFSFTKDLNKENEFVIGFAEVGKDYEFLLATKKDNNKLNKGEKKEYNNHAFYKINEHTFTMDLDSTTIVSSSELLLENLVRNNTNNISYDNNSLKKLIKTNLDNELNVFINLEKKPHFLNALLPTKFLSKTNWTSLSFNGENGINSNGTATDITIGDDFINSISKGENNETYAGSIIPYNYTNYSSYHYKDLTSFKTNFDNFSELINISDEVVYISDDTNNVIAFHLQDHNFIDNLSEIENYRNTTIYQNNYYKIPATLIKPQPSFACLIDNFLILSDKKEALQNTIAHYQNKTTLNHQAFFKETIAEALRESHINISKKTSKLTHQLAEILTDKSIKKVDLKDYPLFNQQVNYEDNYINLNTFIKKASIKQTSIGVSQVASLNLDSPANPNQIHWVKNHKNNQQELLVQDQDHNLYLFNKNGKRLWKNPLNSEIQGRIIQVDLYKNRKLQLAFTTQNEFMVLDRNGKLVEPFRKKLTSNNVLPLSVFDYDKNRNYRFIISYDNKIEMFDNKMKPVKGFKLNKTKSNIKSSPQHIRIGTKDYIVLNEENGKLHIVNRQGKDRTKVKNNFNFTKSPIFTYKNHLLFLDDRAINSVNIATGKTKKETLLSGTDYHFNQLDAIRVSLEDQKLKIKDKSYELEFGTYTSPEIFYQNKKYYISITNIETQQVYLFDSNTKLMAKFPVFGKSKIDLKSNLFATKGEGNNVLIYQL